MQGESMAQFHFVEDYERAVAHLIATMPIDDAMSAAVGEVGTYSKIGAIERDLLVWSGLKDGLSIVDLGCGSGRLTNALAQSVHVEYLGVDIIQSLLDYAKSKSPPHYIFKLHRQLSIPAPDHSADFITAFSVFTHLLHSESYLYLQDMKRALKPNGKIIFSFLEFADPNHWPMFASEIEARRANGAVVSALVTMIERKAIKCWAERLGYAVERIIGGDDAPWGTDPLGQSVAILRP
jgi:ubiquinone/menaquinone biosynthesis C-methylase UbiE